MKTKLRDMTAAACAVCILALYAGIASADSEEGARRWLEAEGARMMREQFPPRAGESVVLDALTGDYRITYYNERQKTLAYATFVPATKIDPAINSKFRLDKTGAVNYGYSISSGEKSRQILWAIEINMMGRVVGSQDLPASLEAAATETLAQLTAISAANKRALTTPAGWTGLISTSEHEASVVWLPAYPAGSQAGIPPKGRLKGLGFASQNLPGLGTVQFKGGRTLSGLPSVGPQSEIKQQLEKLENNNFVPRNAAVPTIAVPVPFNATVLVERIQAHSQTWVAMKLLDAAFAAQLDRYFQAAINSYRLNQPKSGNQQLQAMRGLIKQEHADADKEDDGDDRDDKHNKGDDRDKHKTKRGQIDQLAARVLDFDLKYVMKRMGGDD